MTKEERLKYMRKNWAKTPEEEIEFIPRDVADATHALEELHQLDKRKEKGIINGDD
jgi:hypothetical protein